MFAIVLFPFSYVVRLNVIVWRVLFSLFVYVFLALVCVQFSVCLQHWLILQYEFKYVYDAIVPVWYLFVSCLFYIYWTCFACFGVVALCSQLLCLCLRCCCCARVVALVCLCRLQSYVFLFSDLFVFSYYLLFVLFVLLVRLLLHMFSNACLYLYSLLFVLLVCLLLHMFILFILLFCLVLYANTCHVLFLSICVRVIVFVVCFINMFYVITCFVCFCAARGARTLCQKPYGVCRSLLKGLRNLSICPQCAWKPWSFGFKEQH